MTRSVFCAAFVAAAVSSGVDGFSQTPPGPRTLDNLLREEEPPVRPATPVEASGREEPKPQSVRPNGTHVRPKDGSKDPELDKAWLAYDAAIKTSTAELRGKIAEKYMAARTAAKIDDVTRYNELLEDLDKKGKLPTDDKSLAAAVAATRNAYDDAARDLDKAYKSVVERLLKDTAIDASVAKAVDQERQQLSTQAIPRPQIPPDAIKIGKHSYYVFLDPVTQEQAVAECKKRGGYLARITEPKEFAMFHKKLLLLQKKSHFWVDGTDAANEGTWTFLDGDPMPQPLPWLPGEPNNDNGGNWSGGKWRRLEQDGLAIQVIKVDGAWTTGMDDLEQTAQAGFICEWD
jgi:hypothetical protein